MLRNIWSKYRPRRFQEFTRTYHIRTQGSTGQGPCAGERLHTDHTGQLEKTPIKQVWIRTRKPGTKTSVQVQSQSWMNLRLTVGQGRTVQFIFLLSRHVQMLQGSFSGIHVSKCWRKKPNRVLDRNSMLWSLIWWEDGSGWGGVTLTWKIRRFMKIHPWRVDCSDNSKKLRRHIILQWL